jgi:hypothetical protein
MIPWRGMYREWMSRTEEKGHEEQTDAIIQLGVQEESRGSKSYRIFK